MSFLGGIVKTLVNPVSLAQIAMGPAGWASLAVRTIGVAIGKEVIQQLGQKLGLPQSMISMAQTAFSAAAGGGRPDLASVLGRAAPSSVGDAVNLVARQFNFSPAQEGNLARSANNMTSMLLTEMFEKAKAETEKPEALEKPEAGTARKGSWLQALAEAMGAIVDDKMDEITDLSDKITKQNASNKKFTDGVGAKEANVKVTGEMQSNQTKLGTLTSKLQAATQEMSIMQNTISNALKTIGEAQSGMARKG